MLPPTGNEFLIKALSDLGLSRTEAEVYLACLMLGTDGPVSSYRAARAMGRDPANVGKVLHALARRQAVRVVQARPRLYLPTPPAEFSDQVLTRLQRQRDEAVRLLASYRPPAVVGVAAALTGIDQIVAQAGELLAACRVTATVFGSRDALRRLGSALEQAAEPAGRRVRVLSPVPFASETVQIQTLPGEVIAAMDLADQWLLMAVDDTAWLNAVGSDAADSDQAHGWWSTGTATARTLRVALEVAIQGAESAERTVLPDSMRGITAADETPTGDGAVPAAEATEAAAGSVVHAAADAPSGAAPGAPPSPQPDTPDEEGITFVYRRRRAASGGNDEQTRAAQPPNKKRGSG